VRVAAPFATFATLVGGGAKAPSDLRPEQMLEHPLDDMAQELWIVEHRPLHQLFVEPTMTFDLVSPPSIGLEHQSLH
jgi:hypothetical protein